MSIESLNNGDNSHSTEYTRPDGVKGVRSEAPPNADETLHQRQEEDFKFSQGLLSGITNSENHIFPKKKEGGSRKAA